MNIYRKDRIGYNKEKAHEYKKEMKSAEERKKI